MQQKLVSKTPPRGRRRCPSALSPRPLPWVTVSKHRHRMIATEPATTPSLFFSWPRATAAPAPAAHHLPQHEPSRPVPLVYFPVMPDCGAVVLELRLAVAVFCLLVNDICLECPRWRQCLPPLQRCPWWCFSLTVSLRDSGDHQRSAVSEATRARRCAVRGAGFRCVELLSSTCSLLFPLVVIPRLDYNLHRL
jgi:hypothetical protein